MHKSKYIFLLIIAICGTAYSQQDSLLKINSDLIEEYLSESSNEGEDQDLFNILDDLRSNPVDLNSAAKNELRRIPFIDLHSADLITGYRERHGKFKSLNDLYKIKGIDKSLIELLSPFIQPLRNNKSDLKDHHQENKSVRFVLRSRLSDDIGKAGEYKDAGYPGTPYKIYNRMALSLLGRYEFGITTEKDPGEKSLNDLTSMRFVIKDVGPVNKVVFGDYLFESGQGLALWGPYGLSKSANAVSGVKKRDNGIKSYKSTDENRFMRGAAASLLFDRFNVSMFYSSNRFDALIDPVSNEILSSPSSGFHRTETELSRRKNAVEKLYGLKLNYETPAARLGVLYYQSSFDRLYEEPLPNEPAERKYNYYSVDYDADLGPVNIFGETAYNGISLATLNGIIAAPSRNVAFSFLFRYYPWRYFNLHGFAFGERSGSSSNETGFYTGIRLHTIAGILNFYYDVYKFPYAVYGVPSPSGGNEAAVYLKSNISSNFELRSKIKVERKDYTDKSGKIKRIAKSSVYDYRLELIVKPEKLLRFKGRIEYKKLKDASSGGGQESLMLYQEVRYSPYSFITMTGRIALFRVPSFKTALYEYEYDLPGMFYNSLLLGEGIRWYLLVNFSPLKSLTVSLKYSVTNVPEFLFDGFGASTLGGKIENKLGLQADVEF